MATSVGTPWLWAAFIVLILALLALDLGIFHRQHKAISARRALLWTCIWVALALGFNIGVYFWFGQQSAIEFFAGYLVEKSLSVDNIFVFLMLFSYFGVPASLQHRVLFWGILGALVLRAVFIIGGVALIRKFHFVLYLFGLFLLITGVRFMLRRHGPTDPERNPVIRLVRKIVRAVPEFHQGRFLIKRGGRWYATPLLVVLVAVEITDIIFAIDSIPAIFAITTDPFIVFTSNIFAILGLRALYFLLASTMARFRYLKAGLGVLLVYLGIKMLLVDIVKVPVSLSLGIIAAILAIFITLSLIFPAGAKPPAPESMPPQQATSEPAPK